jgi:hypothetical protein
MRRPGIDSLLVALAAVSLVVCAVASCSAELAEAQQERDAAVFRASFDDSGLLERPRGYRRWVYVGAPLTPNDMNDGRAAFPEFHSVYIDPTSYDTYKHTGAWRDGTTIVKELVAVGGKKASSGAGYFMGDFLGVEVALKSAARFPDEPGNWGYFRFTDEDGGPPHGLASRMPTGACAACHAATADQDLVFTQYYPVLRAAKGVGDREPEDP